MYRLKMIEVKLYWTLFMETTCLYCVYVSGMLFNIHFVAGLFAVAAGYCISATFQVSLEVTFGKNIYLRIFF